MKQFLIARLMEAVFEMLDTQELREYLDDVLDRIEAKHQIDSDLKSQAIMMMVGTVRAVAQIPDDIGGDED